MKWFVFTLMLLIPSISMAQGNMIDVLYLKNGSVIRGTIVEIKPSETVKIRTNDGSLFVYKMDEVVKIEKSKATTSSPQFLRNKNSNPYTIHKNIARVGLLTTYGLTIAGALAMGDESFTTTIIPIAGPWITMNRIENDLDLEYKSGGQTLLTVAGVAQAAFLSYYLSALAGEISYNRKVTILPMHNSTGVSLTYRF